jgi:NHL repeat
MRRVALGALLVAVCTCNASAAGPLRVSLVGKPAAPVAKRAWVVRLAVRPMSFSGTIRLTASGQGRVQARASGRRGSYRARLVLPSPGRWTLTARAGGRTFRLGTTQVRPAPPQPVAFTEPTSIDVESAGTLLLVENNPGRVLRVQPETGQVTALVPSIARPFGVVHTPAGSVFVSNDNRLSRIDATGTPTTVAEADRQIGPVAVTANGDVYFATATQIFRLAGGSGPAVRIAGTGVEGDGGDGGPALEAQFAAPHGLAIAADGALLVSDTENDRIRRINLSTGLVTAFAPVGQPGGSDVAPDGTIFVADGLERRVLHLSASGARLGFVGPAFDLPYDVEVADGGVTYVLEAGPRGWVRRIAADGTVTTVSRR